MAISIFAWTVFALEKTGFTTFQQILTNPAFRSMKSAEMNFTLKSTYKPENCT